MCQQHEKTFLWHVIQIHVAAICALQVLNCSKKKRWVIFPVGNFIYVVSALIFFHAHHFG